MSVVIAEIAEIIEMMRLQGESLMMNTGPERKCKKCGKYTERFTYALDDNGDVILVCMICKREIGMFYKPRK